MLKYLLLPRAMIVGRDKRQSPCIALIRRMFLFRILRIKVTNLQT